MAVPTNDERSLFTLIGELPDTVSTLVRAEIDQIKAEISYKIKHFGIGSGLVAGAAVVGIFLLFTLIVAAIFALALVMPGWAAALVVSGVLLLIIAILLWIAYVNFKRGAEPLETIESLRADLDVLKGTGDYDRRD
ncbi:phage holin family protein [Agromyces ramosus]|uniref:Amino acid permease n=1 Tax=Agromyces ramosus TaxID=33879 RepID=A0ABU0R847_9MICO|nr:phage holin family protein [Agromyces ramosus]MDQ0894257.1 amino acid permease [Agromyces ramosus]